MAENNLKASFYVGATSVRYLTELTYMIKPITLLANGNRLDQVMLSGSPHSG